MSLLRFTLWVTVSLLLVACNERGTRDLEQFVEEAQSRQSTQIEPLPEFVPYETFLYQARDMRDPFSPPVVSQAPVISRALDSGIQPDTRRAREPLESFPLDTLRMVGTLEKNGQSWALVKATDGTIHRVRPGNYMGENYGKIIRISESQIDLVEIVPDGLGGWMEREAALALSDE